MNFADNLKRICTERGTSPTALLKSMGVATSKVAMWNSGSLPKQEMLIRLAKELDCSVMDFFADDADLAAQNINKTNADAEPKNDGHIISSGKILTLSNLAFDGFFSLIVARIASIDHSFRHSLRSNACFLAVNSRRVLKTL